MLILFDAVGTLFETAEPVERAYSRFFARHGMVASPDLLRQSFKNVVSTLPAPDFSRFDNGDGAEREWWRQVVEAVADAAGHRGASGLPPCFAEVFEHYAEASAWRLFSETTHVLAKLRSDGHQLAIVSNFDLRLHTVVRGLGIAEQFDLVLSSAEVGARKPSPRIVLRAMDLLGHQRVSTCLVGDSPHEDGGAAAAAEIPLFLLARPRRDLAGIFSWLSKTFS